MKKDFKIFYSWMSDRPDEQNRKYIRKVIDKDCKKISNELGIKITIDSDSRGEDGSRSIDETILKKITNCDLFIGDITPASPRLKLFKWIKPISNSNVMFELGFAVSSLGWNRCILVWNNKYGNLSQAPFDIRNHNTSTYQINKQELSLYGIIKSKIVNFDTYVRDWRTSKERSFDAEKFNAINEIIPERELIDSIDFFLTNRRYDDYQFTRWDRLQYTYRNYPDTHFVDEEINHAYEVFLNELKRMIIIAATYNVQIKTCNDEDIEVGSVEWMKQTIYKIRNPYDTLTDPKAFELEQKIEKEFRSLVPSLMDSYKNFRDLIRKKLFI